MMLSQYKNDVSDAYASMSKAMRHAYDYRSFDHPSDDPLAAAQTSEVHFQMLQNSDYASNISSVKGEVQDGEKILQDVDSFLSAANSTTTLKAINGTMNKDNRSALADQLLNYRDSIVSELNTKYADSYLFSGSGSGSQPFELVKSADPDHPENDKLFYRGVNVDTGLVKADDDKFDNDNKIINDPGALAPAKTAAQAELNTLKTTGADNLKKLCDDKVYVDVGLGMEVDPTTKEVVGQTAFNRSMPGISYVGCGTDANGTPQNVCSLLAKVAGVLKASSNETLLTTGELNTIGKYTDVFNASQSKCVAGQSKLGNNVSFLESSANYLSDASINLAKRDNDVEYVEPTSAIQDFYSQMYCYNASLKAGSQILQQSLMDYLK